MESTENLTPLNVEQLANLLLRAYLAMVRSGTPFQKFPSVMLWGPPGVGKSQAVRQIAAALEQGTGRRVAVTDVRLLLFNPVDLRGIPAANADRTLAASHRRQRPVPRKSPGHSHTCLTSLNSVPIIQSLTILGILHA